ncbi:transferase [bacterium AM6]|nr:transferase [bacterium AM6]
MPLLNDRTIESVVIAGAGGFGMEVFDYLSADAHAGGPRIAGFIDDGPSNPIPGQLGSTHLGTIGDYQPVERQAVVVAVGSVKGRRLILSRLWEAGVYIPAFVSTNTVTSPNAQLGDGVVVCPYSVINRNAVLGRGVAVNVHCSVGHGAKIGEFSVLSPYAALNGDASVGDDCFLGTRATIYPRTSLGAGCIVDSHTGVRTSAGARQMISSRGTYQVIALRT